jgi:hypothetical protein
LLQAAADAADSAYQDAVRQLDEARLLWEKEMVCITAPPLFQ